MASAEIRERRRTLRYRNLLVRQAVQMKNKIARQRAFALLTRTYHGCRLHGSYPETALCEVKDGVLDVWSAT